MTYQSDKAAAQKDENDKTARIAGAGAGVLAGAQVGTVLLPIPVIGTFTGALVGGVIGTKIGKRVGGALLNKLTSFDKSDVVRPPDDRVDVTVELERLSRLREQGVLDEGEFKAAKAKLLGL